MKLFVMKNEEQDIFGVFTSEVLAWKTDNDHCIAVSGEDYTLTEVALDE